MDKSKSKEIEDKYSVPIYENDIEWERRDIFDAIKSLYEEDCFIRMDVLGMMHLIRVVEDFERKQKDKLEKVLANVNYDYHDTKNSKIVNKICLIIQDEFDKVKE